MYDFSSTLKSKWCYIFLIEATGFLPIHNGLGSILLAFMLKNMTIWHWTEPNFIKSISSKSIEIGAVCIEFQTEIQNEIFENLLVHTKFSPETMKHNLRYF